MKKLIAIVVTLALCAITLVGCGSSTESANYETPASAADIPAGNDELEEPTLEVADVYQEEVEDEVDFGRPPEDECVPWDESAEEEVIPDTGEIEGIIVLQNSFYHAGDGVSNIFVYSISSINPNSGQSMAIAEFSIRRPYNVTSEEFYYLIPAIGPNNRFGYDRRFFSSDYSKMVATKVFNDKNEAHAGWIDQAGNFFDITEALGEQSGDFGDPVSYHAIGFTDDDMFVYSDNLFPSYMYWHDDNFSYVELGGNVSQYGNPLEEKCQIIDSNNRFYCISDIIGDGIFIADGYEGEFYGSVIYDSMTHESKKYIPGESRNNWSGVCSPDGHQVAFLSMPITGNGSPEIFIIPFDGGDPEKLDCDLVFSNDTSASPSSILAWE